ncbi:DNA glycosylase AlkZ-like family protein [Lapillicoccus sp.]|uniref:winged helix-turn-helix domain-containing protein n=1 Tax=Lapillicoccus sp. TaxID=1909287 RepID=UPI0032653356
MATPATVRLSTVQARRIALAAQGFADARPAPWTATTRHLQRVVDRVGIVQIDSVNVVARSQYLPFFARLGPYDTDLLDRARDRSPRRLVESWAHMASLIPPSTWPLLDFRMRRAVEESWGGMQRVAREHPGLVEAVLDEVERNGPLTSRALELALAHDIPRTRDSWGWNWSIVKNALEHLFWSGQITSAGRNSQFERRYASLALVAPRTPPLVREQWLHPAARPSEAEAYLEMVRIAARSHGVGTVLCLRDYFRLKTVQVMPAIEALVARGVLLPARIEGWDKPAWLYAGARRPRAVHAEALLSPFDSLVWQRERTEALFDLRYRIEIYTPVEKRVHGYYVLPFLYGDTLVARCDLKADRAAGVLRVNQVTWQPRVPQAAAEALERNLASMADWLGLAGGVQGSTGWSANRPEARPGAQPGPQ